MNFLFRTLVVASILLLSMSAFSQNSLRGRVIDDKGEALAYATITLLNPVDSTLQFFGVTNDEGQFKIKSIKSNNYILQYSFVGMNTISENISIPSDLGEDIGDKVMNANVLDEVEIVAEYIPIQFKSDTVEFNAKAFTNKPHAVVEDLLKKIPGIEVDETGNMKALGEDVTKVMVDGKEFFGNDPKVATKNLPAKAIKKVQVYDKKSEEAEFMGVDDGVRDRTINLILNEEDKRGYFGELEVGGGLENYYKTSAKLYRFSDKLQSAILGMYNNVNEFGYSGRGHGQWGQKVKGLNTTGAGGLNLSYNANEKNRYFLSYLGRSTATDLEQKSETEFFQEDGSYFQNNERLNDENDAPHGIDFGIRHNFNKLNKLTVDGDVSIASNELNSSVQTITKLNNNLVNDIDNFTLNKSDEIDISAKAVYILKFKNEKTQLKTDFSGSVENNSSALDQNNTSIYYSPVSQTTLSQFQNNATDRKYISANPTLVQEISPFWYLSANVKLGMGQDVLTREQGDPITNILIDTLGADFIANKTLVEPGISLKRNSATQQLNISLGAGINSMEKTLFEENVGDDTWYHLLPGLRYENNYKKGRRFTARYRTNVNMPSVSQLLPVTNTINPLQTYRGNEALEPEYKHDVSVRWSIFDQFSFTSMFMRVGGSHTQNKIGLSRTTTNNFTQELSPVNVAYQNSVYSFVYFSTPIRPLGIKVNIRSSESWNKGITLVNSEENVNTNITHSLRANIENRRKDKWDISVGGSVSLTNSYFSISESQNNQYYNTSYFADLNFTPSEKWNFEADGNIVNYNSKNFTESISIPLLNAGISYFFWRGNKASISLKAYDLLNKNTSIKQVTESNYVLQEESNIIGRRIMLQARVKLGR